MSKSVSYLSIDDDRAGQRIDNFLIQQLKGVPKQHIYKILRKGEVRVNKKRIKAHYRLEAGDIVRIPPIHSIAKVAPRPQQAVMDSIEDSIIYEDTHFLAINKPAGLAVHGGSGLQWGIIEALRASRTEAPFLELVHRLDRDTSGVLVIAKKRSALRSLHALFRGHELEKDYVMAVRGVFDEAEREVNLALMKKTQASGERIVRVDQQGKPASSRFEAEQVLPRVSILRAYPRTGRTHQLRVHAAACGFPIIGDDKYGDFAFNRLCKSLDVNRLMLHARRLQLPATDTTSAVNLVAPVDESWQHAVRQLGELA